MPPPPNLLASLRQSLERFEPERASILLGHAGVDALLRGLRREALHEVYAGGPGHDAAASGFALGLAQRLCGARTLLWIRQDFSALEHGEIGASGFLEMGFNPARLILLRVDHAKDALRAAGDALACKGLGAVVLEIYGEPKALDLTATRRLTLATANAGVSCILLRLGAEADASAAETRWSVRGAPSPMHAEDFGYPRFDTTLARNRHGPMGHWIMEWDCDNGSFCEPAADRFDLAAAPADRPVETEEFRRTG